MGLMHEGVSGDHSTPGWLEWDLEEMNKRRTVEREAVGDFGAVATLAFGLSYIEAAKREGGSKDLAKAEALFEEGITLAAKEARFAGAEIRGWEPGTETA